MSDSPRDDAFSPEDFSDDGLFSRSETQLLLADWCNGVIDPASKERLEELITEWPEAQLMYLEYASMEAELHAAVSGVAPLWNTPEITSSESTDHKNELTVRLHSPHRDQWEAKQDNWLSRYGWRAAEAIAVAAGIMLLVGASLLAPGLVGDRVANVTGAATPSAEATGLAKITATRHCRWGAASSKMGFGAELQAGQRIELVAGLAEITFEDNARVLLEGPAELLLRPESEGGSLLISGRLAATVPSKNDAHQSPVATARLGVSLAASQAVNRRASMMQFGLSASPRDGDEVHVFRGLVDAFLRADGARSVRLASREAARIQRSSTTVAKFFADDDKFVRTLASTGGPQDGLYAYEGFDYPAGPMFGQNGGFGWAGAWADIEAACLPGQIATNVVEEGNLTYGELRVLGAHGMQRAQQNRIRRALSTSLGGVFDAAGLVENQDGLRLIGANGKTVYVSFLQRVSKTDDGFYGVELHRGDGNGNRVLCVGNGAEGAGYGVTSNYNAYTKSNYARLGEENDAANLIVMKIEFGPEHRDLVTVYRNPESLNDERDARVDARLRGNFAFDRMSFGCFDGSKHHEVDEFRIATTYRAATGLRDRGSERLLPVIASATRPSERFVLKATPLVRSANVAGYSEHKTPRQTLATPLVFAAVGLN